MAFTPRALLSLAFVLIGTNALADGGPAFAKHLADTVGNAAVMPCIHVPTDLVNELYAQPTTKNVNCIAIGNEAHEINRGRIVEAGLTSGHGIQVDGQPGANDSFLGTSWMIGFQGPGNKGHIAAYYHIEAMRGSSLIVLVTLK